MNKSKLKTDFICIATSGYTVDERQITAQELHDMAESYDLAVYTANLWFEHRRWGNFGQVLALKAEDQPNGETKLFAVLAPNSQLIEMNRHGQAVFTSVEITPNFRNSGKSYLTGLGVTDSPASVGTTQLQFFNQTNNKNTQFGEFIAVDFTLADDTEEKINRGMFNALKRFFTTAAAHSDNDEPAAADNPNNNNDKEDIPMDKQQFNQLIAAVNGLGDKLDKHFAAQPKAAEPEQPTEPAAEPEKTDTNAKEQGVTAEQFSQLTAAVTALTEKFNALSQETTTVPNGLPVNNKAFNIAV